MFDFMALGDGEEALAEIGACLRQCRLEGLDRVGALHRLATTVEGVYVPQFYDPPKGCACVGVWVGGWGCGVGGWVGGRVGLCCAADCGFLTWQPASASPSHSPTHPI